MPENPHFFDLDPDGISALVDSLGLPAFRAAQLLQWVYEKGVADPLEMSNLSRRDRDLLAERITFRRFSITQHQSASDGTQKLLLGDGQRSQTECVMIPSENPSGTKRRTACISSQVGCPVGCRFCASGIGGLEKNLTAGQIVEQVWWLNQISDLRFPISDLVEATDRPGPAPQSKIGNRKSEITNVVFMGMGEPLSNFENVVQAIRTLTAPWGMGISGRKITVSTVGLPAQIRRLAKIDVPLTLAISLHAPNDELRATLIPWAQHTTIEAIVEAAAVYFDETGREVTLEYILLRNVNDRPEHARQLAAITKRLRCNVNLIRYNEVKGLPFDRPTTDDVRKFQDVLTERGVNAHLRASRGRDIAAACGQLRHETREKLLSS